MHGDCDAIAQDVARESVMSANAGGCFGFVAFGGG